MRTTIYFDLPIIHMTRYERYVATNCSGTSTGVWMKYYVRRIVRHMHVGGRFRGIPFPFQFWPVTHLQYSFANRFTKPTTRAQIYRWDILTHWTYGRRSLDILWQSVTRIVHGLRGIRRVNNKWKSRETVVEKRADKRTRQYRKRYPVSLINLLLEIDFFYWISRRHLLFLEYSMARVLVDWRAGRWHQSSGTHSIDVYAQLRRVSC